MLPVLVTSGILFELCRIALMACGRRLQQSKCYYTKTLYIVQEVYKQAKYCDHVIISLSTSRSSRYGKAGSIFADSNSSNVATTKLSSDDFIRKTVADLLGNESV